MSTSSSFDREVCRLHGLPCKTVSRRSTSVRPTDARERLHAGTRAVPSPGICRIIGSGFGRGSRGRTDPYRVGPRRRMGSSGGPQPVTKGLLRSSAAAEMRTLTARRWVVKLHAQGPADCGRAAMTFSPSGSSPRRARPGRRCATALRHCSRGGPPPIPIRDPQLHACHTRFPSPKHPRGSGAEARSPADPLAGPADRCRRRRARPTRRRIAHGCSRQRPRRDQVGFELAARAPPRCRRYGCVLRHGSASRRGVSAHRQPLSPWLTSRRVVRISGSRSALRTTG